MLERWRRPGGKKYVTRRSRVTYFLQPGRESIKNTYCMGKRPFLFFIANLHAIFNDILRKKRDSPFIVDYDSERVCRWGVFLNAVRPMGSTPFDAFPF